MYRIGNIEIHHIVASHAWADPGGMFGVVPRALWSRAVVPDERGLVPMNMNILLVRAGGKSIVVETGLGDKLTAKQYGYWGRSEPGDLVGALKAAGAPPEAVDIVLLTHLHMDHAGGATTRRGGEIVPTFPNAEYWVQRREYADACFPNERTRATYLPENFKPLEAAGQLRLLMGDTHVVEGVRCVVARGHTRAHQIVVFESEGQHGLFAADMASYAVNFERLAWVAANDIEPLETIETKRAWQHWALTREALVFTGHEIERPAGRLRVRDGGRYWLEPTED